MRKTKRFSILRSIIEVEDLLDGKLPENECYKFITNGGYSSISFVMYICDRVKVKEAFFSSLRVGKNELRYLDLLKREGKLDKCNFIVGGIMRGDKKQESKYGYYEDLVRVCESNGWRIAEQKNHSKLLLFDTDSGKFVIETSSNLNENPSIEQFSFEKDKELFNFYKRWFMQMLRG